MNTRLHFVRNMFLLLVFCGAFLSINSQNVTRVEYFVDKDPGFGSGHEVTISPGLDISANFQFNIDTLSTGFHNLYVRSYVNPYMVVEEGNQVTKGGWSLVQTRTFYKENITIATGTVPDIVKGEYFIDRDLGFEMGHNITLTSAMDLNNLSFAFDVTTLDPGFHNLYVRFKDARGNWSLCSIRNFYKEVISSDNSARPNIIKGEYFIDDDRGFGKGHDIPFIAATDVNNLSFTCDISDVPAGFHTLYVRFSDANNTWSHAGIRTFYKESLATTGNSLPNITGGEFFIDKDPGFGGGNPISFTPGNDVSNITFAADVTSVGSGFHNICTRFRDANGKWGLTNSRSFYKETFASTMPLSNIVKLEYFVDSDPGFGEGAPVSVNPAIEITALTFPINMPNVSIGNHRIYVRALDAAGNWSLVSKGSFEVEPPAAIYITVGDLPVNICAGASLNIPFSVNTPYGSNNVFTAQLSDANGNFDNPVNIGSFTGNNPDTILAVIPESSATGSAYRVRILASSPIDTSAISGSSLIINRVPEKSFVINGKTQACVGMEQYQGSDIEANTTYAWTVSEGVTIAENGSSATINWTVPGSHTLKLAALNSCGKGVENVIYVDINDCSGQFGNSISLNGVNDYIHCGNNTALNISGALTLEAWIKPTAFKLVDEIIQKGGSGNIDRNGYQLRLDAGVGVNFIIGNNTTYNDLSFPVSSNDLNQWMHIAAVYDGSTMKLYRNGVLVKTRNSILTISHDTLPLLIGKRQDGFFFKGFLDEIRVWNTARTQTQIVELLNRQLSGIEPGLVGYWDMNRDGQGAGLVVNNKANVTGAVSNGVTAGTSGTPIFTSRCVVDMPRISASGPLTFCEGGTVVLTSSSADGNTWSTGATTRSITVNSSGSYSVTVGTGACAANSASTVVTVNPSTNASFDAIAPICSGAKAPILPGISINGISGTWNPSVVSNISTGTYIFTPSSGQCIVAEPLIIVVNPVITPIFAAIPAISYGAVAPVLPGTSQNGITGTWSPATVSNTQTATYTFTPSGAQCADTATLIVVVKVAPDLAVQNVAANQSTVSPNDTITVSWDVANVGTAQSIANWTERIYIQSLNGENRTLLDQSVFTTDGILNTGQTVSRSTEVTIPAQLTVGDQGLLVVQLLPGTAIGEPAAADSNNTGIQQSPLTFRKLLTLSLSDNETTEASADGLTVTVNRSGSLTNALSVNISLDKAERFSFPSLVVIPVGQAGVSFTFTANDNNAIEGLVKDTVRVSATGFQEVKAGFTVLDNDKPSLSVANLTVKAMEGDTVTFQVITNLAPVEPLQVFLTSANQLRFPLPASITIPAGSTAAIVTVYLAQDDIPEIDIPVSINAGASSHNPANASIEVNDDDLPDLELTIQTNTIAESAGYFATQATLRRTAKSNPIAFTANLSSSLGGTLILPSTLSLAAGENEKIFTIGVIDNAIVDGQRKVSITASILVNSCGCNAPPATAGSVSADLVVNDDDGPSLALAAAPLTLAEGLSSAGLLRVTRNTDTAVLLLVNLSSSNTNEATVPATATIPAGKVYVDVPITTFNDGVTDGNQQVYFNATASGFSQGTVWVVVTDQNKPDFQIPLVTVNSPKLQAMALFNYQVSVKNTGFATAPSGVLVYGYLSKDDVIDFADSLISVDTVTTPFAVDQTAQIVNAAIVPNLPGQYKLLFKVNPTSALSELLVSNNMSQPVSLTITPDYTATASVDASYFVKRSTVPITGSAKKSDGTAAANVPVEVHIITNGFRREVTVTTNPSGNYAAEFSPLSHEAGHYVIGAGYPGINNTEEQDAFDILGLRINDGTAPKFLVKFGDMLTGMLKVENMSDYALSNLTLRPMVAPNGAVIRFDTLASLGGNASANIGYKVSGTTLTGGKNYQIAKLQAVASEGIIQESAFQYYCQAPQAFLVADITNIDVKVSQSKGEHQVQFTLVNKGSGSTGNIKINLPQVNWLNSITPVDLPAMSTGDTALVILKFSALPEVPFNFPISGTIGINTQNGNSFSISFNFQKKSETNGYVKVTATDQFTYFSEAQTKVKDAHVVIQNYFTNVIYAEGNTDENGVFLATGIPEGTHKITVEKDKHLPYYNTITINPGDTIATTAFLNYQAITFSWTVVPTAVQDLYDITLTALFETHVPMPVVTIDMPKIFPQLSGNETYAFNITLTNHGLIAAKEVKLTLPEDLEYEFVSNYQTADLGAQQSIQIPAIMRRRLTSIKDFQATNAVADVSRLLGINAARGPIGSLACKIFSAINYTYICGGFPITAAAATMADLIGRYCVDNQSVGEIVDTYVDNATGGGSFGGVVSSGGGGYSGGSGGIPAYQIVKNNCNECLNDVASAIISCYPPTSVAKRIFADAICFVGAIDRGKISGFIKCGLLSGVGALSQPLSCFTRIVAALQSCRNKANKNNPGLLAKAGGSDAMSQITDNLSRYEHASSIRSRLGTEWFGDLTASEDWKDFYPLIADHVGSFDSIPLKAQNLILNQLSGYELQPKSIASFFARWNNSIHARNLGILAPNDQYPTIINWKMTDALLDSLIDAHNYAVEQGFQSIGDMADNSFNSLNELINGEKSAVCATVKIQISQKLAMTREAFEGTLEIFNGHPTDKMDSLSVNVMITDENGVPANGLFEIQTKSLINLSDVTGTGNIAAQQKGAVKFIFIPEIGAAPRVPKLYKFGGTVRYFDPYVKAIVTLPLAAVQLTVNPSPNLMLHYFMQRNILGDDPLTSPDIEPIIPAELAVMVENQGYGPAVNMTISSAQPKIVENEKGLAINFSLVGSKFQGQSEKLGVTNINFGTIPALQTRVGEWYLTSSLLGKFVSYEASVVHANSFGNPDLSLVKGVKLHELTKSIHLYGELEDGINDFLVNDIFDIHDVPDIIYFSQGNRTAKVAPAASGSFSGPVAPPSFTNTLTVTASKIGWNYIELNDPGNRQYELVSVTRSDGQVIPLDNAWLTFVTLPVSQAPVYENKFNFADTFPSLTPVSYTVVWKPGNINGPNIISISGAPEQVTATQVKTLTVVFDKPIDTATFTYEDLTLTFQGGSNIINSSVKIIPVDAVTFNVDLSNITTGNGFYNFTAQVANVKDIYGISGQSGRQYTWTQFLTVPTVQAFLGLPDENLASSYDTINVLFNLPIDTASVTPDRFTILKDSVVQSGNIVIDSIRADHKLFYLSGLKNILTQNGTYEFRVNLANIRSESQEYGVQPQSVNLTVDNAGPVITHMETSNAGGLDSQHITFVNIKFNEGVVGFNTASVTLTRNGETVPLNIAQLSNTDLQTWMAGNFGLLTYPDGNYTFTVNISGFADAIGNKGNSSQQISWTVNHTALITISNLSVTPDLGFSGTDGITSGQTLNVNFGLSANAAKITISQVDFGGETELAAISNVAAGNISLPFTLPSGGNTGIKVIAIGANGGSDTVQRSLFIDQLPLIAQWIFEDNRELTAQIDTIPLSFSSRLISEAGMLSAIQLKRNGNIIPSAALHVEKINDTAYYIYGLRQASSLPGDYQITYNLQPFSKYRTGMNGVGVAVKSWKVLSTNRAPVANAGTDITVTSSGAYSVNGKASYDPDSDPVTYRWIVPEGITLSDSTVANPSFNITAANNSNKYSLLLVVSDGTLFSTDVVEVTVNLATGNISFSGLADNHCYNQAPVILVGFPAGGTFSGAGISGNIFTPSDAGLGTHEITYALGDQSYSQNTKVNATVTPIFNTVNPICSGSEAPVLSTTSSNGITGTWNPATVSNTASATYTFTPDAGQCANTITISVTVNPTVPPTFEDIAPICAGSVAPVLPTTSSNGITGTWNPATVNNTASAMYIFTPDAGQCADTATISVTVDPTVTPAFADIAPICAGSAAPVLPTISTNGITGTWKPAIVSNTASGTYTFTPDRDQCATIVKLAVTIHPLPTVTLSTFDSVCNTTAPFALAGGTPSGGTYSGTGVSNGKFDAATAGVGTFVISYSYTNGNGCTNIERQSIKVGNCAPECIATIKAEGPTTFCEGGSVTLTALPQGCKYVWMPGGQTTRSITVTKSGTYTVTVIGGDHKCVAVSKPLVVVVSPLPAVSTITASGPIVFPQGGSVVLTASEACAYLWSNGDTTRSIKVSISGTYTVIVKNCNGCAAKSGEDNVIVNNCYAYCTSGGSSNCTGYIDCVNFKTIDNKSGWNNGYGNFLNLTANVWKGREDWIRVTPGYPRLGNTKMYVRVWIDWNQDGKFGDNELAFAPFWPHKGSVSGKILIPGSAKTGITRMRVAMKAGSPPVACGSFESGEVEDYSIMVSETVAPKYNNRQDEEVPEVKPDYLIYPNPVASELVIELTNFDNLTSKFSYINMMVTNVSGKVVMQRILKNTREIIDVSKFANGIYMVHLEANGYVSTQKIIVSH